MINSVSELQPKAAELWEHFRTTYHATMARLSAGENGSEHYPGASILLARSETQKVARCIDSVAELLNGSGEVPDVNHLYSYAGREGVGVEGFTSMVCCLVIFLDVMHSLTSGDADTVSNILDLMLGEGAPNTTAENTPLNMPTMEVTTSSRVQAVASKVGQNHSRDSTSKTTVRRSNTSKKKPNAKKSSGSNGRKRKSTPKKRKKSQRK